MSATPMLKLVSMADSCLASLPVSFASMNSSRLLLPLGSKAISCPLFSCSSSTLSSSPLMLSLRSKNIVSIAPLGAQPSRWLGDKSSDWNEGDAIDDGESRVNEGSVHGDAGESYPELLEEAKLFVGNLPFDIDSEKLAHLFKKAGVVEVSEVIYNRQTAQSRGFGFVTMSTVEDAERAVELFHSHDYNGRLLTVNKAAARGSRSESPRYLDPSFRIYVGNLSWQVDDARLGQLFSEHGKVSNARVVYDRETGRSRGFGFVTMASQTELDDAIAALDGQSFDGRAIRVNVAEERQRRGSF